MTLKKILTAIATVVFVLTFLSCSKSNNNGITPPPGGGTGGGTSTTINIYNMAFPASTSVKKGTIVKWFNQDGFAHTVTSNDGTSFSSGNLAAGATFSYTATTTGTFTYHCTIHAGMTGILIVTD